MLLLLLLLLLQLLLLLLLPGVIGTSWQLGIGMSGQSVHQLQQAGKGAQAAQKAECNAAAVMQTRCVYAGSIA